MLFQGRDRLRCGGARQGSERREGRLDRSSRVRRPAGNVGPCRRSRSADAAFRSARCRSAACAVFLVRDPAPIEEAAVATAWHGGLAALAGYAAALRTALLKAFRAKAFRAAAAHPGSNNPSHASLARNRGCRRRRRVREPDADRSRRRTTTPLGDLRDGRGRCRAPDDPRRRSSDRLVRRACGLGRPRARLRHSRRCRASPASVPQCTGDRWTAAHSAGTNPRRSGAAKSGSSGNGSVRACLPLPQPHEKHHVGPSDATRIFGSTVQPPPSATKRLTLVPSCRVNRPISARCCCSSVVCAVTTSR